VGGPPGSPPAELRAAAAHVFSPELDAPELAGEDAHHLVRVLRLRDGDPVTVSDGAGSWRSCALSLAIGTDPSLRPDGPVQRTPDPQPAITVAVALPKGDRGDWAVQKLTELGVDRIVLVAATRSVVRWEGERAERGRARLGRVARQAAMQSRRTRLVELAGPLSAAQVVAGDEGRVCAADPGGGGASLSHPVVLVGPEGGWAPGEIPESVPTLGLGPTVLRTETACLAAAAALVLLRAGSVGPPRQ
jgi:16S rRNA (uracil1498-N3)-methyltransferase